MVTAILKSPNGSLEMEPGSTTIETDAGVYIAYDINANETDYTFKEGYELVGTLHGDLRNISDPDTTWLSDMKN
jgi:hypothetical protein